MKLKQGLSLVLTMLVLFTIVGHVAGASAVPTFKVDGRLFVTPEGEPQAYIKQWGHYV